MNDVPWISTNWDGWKLSPETEPQAIWYTSIDQYALTSDEVLEALSRVLSMVTVNQVVVSAGDLIARSNLWIRRDARPGAARPNIDGPPPALYPRPGLQDTYDGSGNPIERLITDIWQELLGIEPIGIHDNFFELGGHSLLGTRVLSRVRALFQVELTLRHLFAAPTVAGLALAVTQHQDEPPHDTLDSMTRIDPGNAEQLLANLDQLSDEDVEVLLRSRLTDDGGKHESHPSPPC
jgi:hypothetical protein